MHSQTVGGGDSGHIDRASLLATAFDRAFAEPAVAQGKDHVDFLAVRIGADSFAIRLAETAGLFADRPVTPVPTSVAEFRGIAGFRGALVPVYDLAALLGYPPAASGRWMILAAGGRLALAFDAFEGHFRVEREAIVVRQGSGSARHVHQIARQGDVVWPVVDLASAVATIRAQVPNSTASKE